MAALGIEQNKAQSELKQAALEKQQHSVIQPLACAPEHCVYICNLTYPLGSQRTPLLFLFFCLSTITTMFSLSLIRSQPSCLYSPSCSVALIIASFPFSFTQRYSQANTPTHFLTLTPIHKRRRSHSLNVSEPLQPAQFLYLLQSNNDVIRKIFPFWSHLRLFSSLL